METPDVTKIQAASGGMFVIVLGLAIQAGMTGTDLMVVAVSTAVVTAAAMVSDAVVRHGRSGAHGHEMHGFQANAAVFNSAADEPTEDA